MEKRNILAAILIVVAVLAAFLIYKSQEISRLYKAKAQKGLEQVKADSSILTQDDINILPAAVQKYLKYTGSVGKEKVKSYKVASTGQMKTSPDKGWVKIETEQYSFVEPVTRLYHIKGNFFGIPAVGLDSYLNGKGGMYIKLGGLIKVVDGKGPEMDQGALVTMFNDMCLLAPATLINKNIQWEEIDSKTVKATFENNGCNISALLYFNDEGALINFVTDDRFYSPTGTTFEKTRWSTAVRDYKYFDGVRLGSYGEAIWHFPQGDYCYAKATIEEVKYNVKEFR